MKTRYLLCAVALVLSGPILSAQVQEAWVRRAGPIVNNLPLVIRADNASNAYVSATTYVSGSLYNFITLKYAADGTMLWNIPYNSAAGNSDDEAGALTVDDSGNVYVAGSSRVGADPRSLKVIKYGPNGNQLWLAEYAEADVQPVAVIRVNAVYVAGTSYSTNSGSDYITLKYDLNGNAVWARRYTGIERSTETLAGMALDPAGDVVVTGTSYSGDGHNKIVTVKYDPDGNPVWTNTFVSAGGFNGEAKAIVADYTANVYIAMGDSLLVKLDRDGQQVWSRNTGNGFWNMVVYPLRNVLALDFAGNIFVTGASPGSSWTYRDYLTVKFDPDGNRLWRARYSGAGRYADDSPSALKVDVEGNSYVTGYSALDQTNVAGFATVKYDPNGNQVWAVRYDTEGGNAGIDLALTLGGDVYVTGHSYAAATPEENVATIKYRQFAVAGLPQITSPPQSAQIIAGTNVTFEVTATGNAPLSYQWRFMGALLAGETNRTLTLVNPTKAQAGDYSVIVSNAVGVTVSPEAGLTVFEPPSIPIPWANLLVTEGGRVYREAYALGDPPLWHQWQFNGTDLPGETNNHLLLFNLGTNDAGNYSLVVTNQYGRAEKVVETITMRLKDTLDRWSWRHPLPQGNDLRDIAYGNGRFVAVGQDGTILVSGDGVTWTNRSVDWLDLVAVAFGNGQFVAVGFFGGLLTSPDGEHWTKPHVPNPTYPRDFSDVAFGNGRFVAVGSSIVVWSEDGVHWQESDSGRLMYFTSVGYGNGTFLAYASYPYIGLASADGATWTTNTVEPSGLFIQSVAFGNGLFVAEANGNGIYISADGFSWTNRAGGYFQEVAFANDAFLAVGDGIARSTDGLHWNLVLPAQTNVLRGVAYGDGKFVTVGNNGMILASPDGISWTERGGGTPNNLRGIARAPSGFAAIGNQGAIWTSADGFAWTNRGSITTNNLRAIAFGADKLVSVSDEGAIFTSSNGAVWTTQSAPTNGLYGLHYGGGRFVAVGDDGTILVSSNGANWIETTAPTTARLQGITFGKGLYVATGRGGAILTSSNALTWTARPSPTGQYLESVVASSNLFVAVGQNGTIVVSPDGITWNTRDVDIEWDIESVAYGDGTFVAVGDRGRVVTSPNGGDWLSRFTGCYTGLRNVIYADGAFWAAGNNETILKSGQTRPFLLARRGGNEFNVLIEAELGKAHRLQSSSNLVSWSDLFNFTPAEESTVYGDTQNERARFYRVVSP